MKEIPGRLPLSVLEFGQVCGAALVSFLKNLIGCSNLASQLRFICSSFDLTTRCAYYWGPLEVTPCEPISS